MRAFLATIVILLGAAAAAVYASAFIVHQNEQALVLRFGEPKRMVRDPGLHWKVPILDTVDLFDRRILDIDTAPQEVTASDQKRLVVDGVDYPLRASECAVWPSSHAHTLRNDGDVPAGMLAVLVSDMSQAPGLTYPIPTSKVELEIV